MSILAFTHVFAVMPEATFGFYHISEQKYCKARMPNHALPIPLKYKFPQSPSLCEPTFRSRESGDSAFTQCLQWELYFDRNCCHNPWAVVELVLWETLWCVCSECAGVGWLGPTVSWHKANIDKITPQGGQARNPRSLCAFPEPWRGEPGNDF